MIRLKELIYEQEEKYPADAPEHFGGGENIDIFGYQTKHFDICRSAVTLYENLKEMVLHNSTECFTGSCPTS